MKVEDFGAYWTGTLVNGRGGNAYDPDSLLEPQRLIDPGVVIPGQVWSPPWTFPLLAPFTAVDFATARWAWRFVQIGSLFLSVTAVWRVYGGPPEKLIWGWCAALAWYPSLQTVGLGQNCTLVLLGVAGGLGCLVAGRAGLAGAVFAFSLAKPQNLYLLGLLAVVWAIDRRQWRPAIGACLAAFLLTVGAIIQNPDVFSHYLDAFARRPPAGFVPPTFGMALRLLFGVDRFWLSFLPTAVGLVWGIWFYVRNRDHWDWADRLPIVVIVSCLTSPYGWIYDQVLFLVPVTQLLAISACRRPQLFTPILLTSTALTAVCFGLHSAGLREVTFLWHAPVVLVLYLFGRRAVTKPILQIGP
jgi:hypothetical protein